MPAKPQAGAVAEDRSVPLLIQGLTGQLPAPGTPFPKAARDRWLNALAVNLDLLYGDADET
jgi:hypothetical protein